MASETDIVNAALSRIGQQPILDLTTEQTKTARTCRTHYETVRDAVMEAHPWNFATRRAALALEVAEPAFEYGFQYALPTDFLRLIRTSLEADGCRDDYRIEYDGTKRVFLSNESSVKIEYIARIADPNAMSPTVRDLIADRLAAEICMEITRSREMVGDLLQKYEAKLREARYVDGTQGTPRQIVDDTSWLRARV